MDVREIEDWVELAEIRSIIKKSEDMNLSLFPNSHKDVINGEFMKLKLQLHNVTERIKKRENL